MDQGLIWGFSAREERRRKKRGSGEERSVPLGESQYNVFLSFECHLQSSIGRHSRPCASAMLLNWHEHTDTDKYKYTQHRYNSTLYKIYCIIVMLLRLSCFL